MASQFEEYLAVLKASYDYEPQSDDEIKIKEDQILFLIEKVDEDWWKVKVKGKTQDEDSPVGLVPAAYVEPAEHTSVVKALYDYEASANGELSIKEDEQLLAFDMEDDWLLVQTDDNGGKAGFVPGNYVEPYSAEEEEPTPAPIAASQIVIPSSPPRPVSTYVDPADRVASSKVTADDIKTWSVSEVDAKGKKKKGTLGVGNGAVFFASESDKTPVQKWQTSIVERIAIEKSKHVHIDIEGSTPISLHFSTGSRDLAEEIVAKLHSSKQISTSAASPSSPQEEPEPAATPVSEPVSRTLPPPLHASSAPPKAVHFSPKSPSIISARENDDEASGSGEPAVALYDFTADGDDELSVAEGENLTIVEKDGDEWWKCRNAKGKEGVVPASYLEVTARANTANRPDSEVYNEEEEEEEDDGKAAQEEEDRRLAQRLQREQEKEAEKERQERHRKKQEAEARAKEAAAAAETERKRRKAEATARPSRSETPPNQNRSSSDNKRSSTSSGQTDNGFPPADRVRVWHDRTGQFRVEAAFLGLNQGKLRLHKVNGVIVEVPQQRMSPEDLRFVEKVTSKRPRNSAKVSDDDVPLGVQHPEAAARRTPTRSDTAPAPKKGPRIDWFDFFLSAGCDVDDCTRYASSFERDKIDEAILPDITESTMRSLGLREGDIIRVNKAIEKRKPKTADTSPVPDGMKKANGAPNLFAGPGGVLKNNAQRRGRPQPSKSLPIAVDINAISSTPEPVHRTESPAAASPVANTAASPVQPPPRSSSALASGFDDDAWTNRPSSTKPLTPTPSTTIPRAPSAPPAPVAPPAPAVPPVQATLPTSVTPNPSQVAPAPAPAQSTPAGLANTTESDIFNQLARLSQLKVASPPAPSPPASASPSIVTPPTGYHSGLGMGSSPATMGQHLQQAATGNFASPQIQQQNGPRGPYAPVPANQGLLQPLIPTQTGFNNFVPTRATASPFQSQPTGFNPSPMVAQPTGMPFNGSFQQGGSSFGSSPFQNGGSSFQGSGSFTPVQSNPTGFNSFSGYGQVASNPTGFQPQFGQVQSNPTGFNSGFSQSSFNAMSSPPPVPPLPSNNTNNTSPANVFAQMKSGTFANDAQSSQPAANYDALRPNPPAPQATGWGGYQGGFGGYQH